MVRGPLKTRHFWAAKVGQPILVKTKGIAALDHGLLVSEKLLIFHDYKTTFFFFFFIIQHWAPSPKFLHVASSVTLWLISKPNAILTVLVAGPREGLHVLNGRYFTTGLRYALRKVCLALSQSAACCPN